MIIRVLVLSIDQSGVHLCQMVHPRPGHLIRLATGEALVLVEWCSGGPGEPLEISEDIARREGLLDDSETRDP